MLNQSGISFLRLNFIRFKKIVIKTICNLYSLRFYKHNCIDILVDNIRSHKQVKNQ